MHHNVRTSQSRAKTVISSSTSPMAANDSPDDVTPAERLSWLVELMSRYAREFMQSSDQHESPRLAAAIVSHLKSLANDLPASGRLTDANEHWLEMWDEILSRHLRHDREPSSPLRALIERARAF
ncbi:MAG: hypothetical protein ACRDAM_01580 [Casimicrobium sp.]